MTLVSIVIPCFNHGRFLGEAIESARAQTWRNAEIVVIDDGSTDDTRAVAARHRDVRLVSQANGGLASARNVGMRVSRGDVLIFLDADDRLRPEAAEAGIRALEAHPRAMLAFGRCQLIDGLGRPLATNLPEVPGNFYEELLRRNYIWMPAMAAYRRELFDTIGGFDPRLSPAADYDMYLRIARRFEIAPHTTVVAEYRQHDGNMSRNPVMMLDATLAVLRAQRAYACHTRSLRSAWRDGDRRWRAFYGDHLVQQFRAAIRMPGGWRRAVWCAAQLLRLYPRGVAHHLGKKIRAVANRYVPVGRSSTSADVVRSGGTGAFTGSLRPRR